MNKTVKELSYSEILTIRRALEHYAGRLNPNSRSGSFSEHQENEKKEAERLQWAFKDASRIEIHD